MSRRDFKRNPQAKFKDLDQMTKKEAREEAAALREGIEQARRQGNSHAAGEMSEFLAGLGSVSGS